ncbi:hypothetical protein [Saccharothrix coeruleofusca]|uniref:DUF5709 domain-containing protein n=1 Tax=Saccharothrix coeruleofusca TaxID=33919 RepID=A0A918AN69_9PSEU|nr:hypothetical protein [Saccharothrix coeruleofusca]MBP2336175.1 hypothetical protein [Saccharothrix coeruleofusca]GGP54878.1 hypothetical protein GCM10010185_29240 [Saccharothrix coeruleofusca]
MTSSEEQEFGSYTPPHDTGSPDAVETDPAALNSAEDLDEDRLRLDPLEAGMDPPERWVGADQYGTTPYEQRTPRPLDERLAEEQPETAAQTADEEDPVNQDLADVASDVEPDTVPAPDPDLDDEALAEAARRGQTADDASSFASSARLPHDRQ